MHIKVMAQTQTINYDKSSQIEEDLSLRTTRSVEIQCPRVKRRGMQTLKVPSSETPTETIGGSSRNNAVQCNNDAMTDSSTLTDCIMGVDASVNTDPPCGKHIQTIFVKMRNKKSGTNNTDSSVQTNQGTSEQLNTYVKEMHNDLQYVTGRMQSVLQHVINTYERLAEIEHDDQDSCLIRDQVT